MALATGRRLFEYHCYEGEDSADAELWRHTHQPVEVLRKIGEPPEYETRMYRVRFADGLEADVFDDELVHDTSEFQRKDYHALSPS